MGQTLLDKVRAQDKTAKLSVAQQKEALKQDQKRLDSFVKSFMAPPDEKLQKASPNKVQRTGNVVLDKISKQIELQRSYF